MCNFVKDPIQGAPQAYVLPVIGSTPPPPTYTQICPGLVIKRWMVLCLSSLRLRDFIPLQDTHSDDLEALIRLNGVLLDWRKPAGTKGEKSWYAESVMGLKPKAL